MFKAAEGSDGLSKFSKTSDFADTWRAAGFFPAVATQDLCFTAQSERNLASEKGHLFSWGQGTSGCGSGLLTRGAAVLAAARSSSGYQWYFSLLFNHKAVLSAWTLNVKKQHEHTCHSLKHMKLFWGVQNTTLNDLFPWKIKTSIIGYEWVARSLTE